MKQLLCFLLQLAPKNLPGILSPVGDQRSGDFRYHTAHQLVCKPAWEVLLEGLRWCRFIATRCDTLCSIHCHVKVGVYYQRC